MVSTATKPVTVEELWELRHEPYRLALIDGELHRMPGAGGTHGLITTNCAGTLNYFVKPRGLGGIFTDTGFRLFDARDTTLFPDVAFVRTERMPPEDQLDRFLRLVPDLAIEIVSPTDYPKLLGEKLALYAEAVTPEVWVIRPRLRTIAVIQFGRTAVTLNPDDTLRSADLLPGFAVRVADLFG